MAKQIGREAKFLKALKKGDILTRKQVMARFKLKNPSAALIRFQDAGARIQRSYTKNKQGQYRVKYSIK